MTEQHEPTKWERIKAMPTLKELRWARRVAGTSFTQVTPSVKPELRTGRELRAIRNSTRRKRAKVRSLTDRS